MFKKFSNEEVKDKSKIKSSQQRAIRQAIQDQYPSLDPYFENVMPKKSEIQLAKCEGKINLVMIDGEPVFYNVRDGPYYPTLRVHHQYPFMMPTMRVDKGAIKFVLSGANIMCPGLTHKNVVEELANKPVDNNTPVAILAEGKEHALAIGHTQMSSQDIIQVNKGIGVNVVHHLNDGLWKTPKLD
ncbi:hypothetical protein GUITHDRAFT_86059 [Guillardia theta CCMP2712]|uniref:PUA domain-containing protein n=1 Tax=Guillardia theta (strain CCMP2712) TaxID=905079 RepID=L1JJA7_GUITC|nr:hypothetical protein GUITHDRAFT_86059 [Guillardia theta CCMP2712]EKX48234.1 hypothetical protein GUITHDRAFT_86059 [Guillardia theta CCMP2712]|eukprot:XP_005835214.1 hypothetical protein GUITHDRAFT_86059 [Guillardia theta CCMP2712]